MSIKTIDCTPGSKQWRCLMQAIESDMHHRNTIENYTIDRPPPGPYDGYFKNIFTEENLYVKGGTFTLGTGTLKMVNDPVTGTSFTDSAKQYRFDNTLYIQDNIGKIGINVSLPNETLDINGTLKVSEYAHIYGDLTTYGETVFNNNKQRKNLQVKSKHKDHMLFVDGSNNRVCIGSDANGLNLDDNVELYVYGDTVFRGNMIVLGETTRIESTVKTIADKDLVLASGSTTDMETDGGGLILKGGQDKTILWKYADGESNWTFSENVDLDDDKSYKINNALVLNKDTLQTTNIKHNSGKLAMTIDSSGNITTKGEMIIKQDIIMEGFNLYFGNGESISNDIDGHLIMDTNCVDIYGDLIITGDILISGNELSFGKGVGINNLINETLTVDASCVDICGNLIVEGDITVTGNDIYFGYGERISNELNGVIMIDANRIDICGNLIVDGNITMNGFDLTLGYGNRISNETDGIISIDASCVDICGNLIVKDNIFFEYGERICNDTDGVLIMDASCVDICGNLLVEGDATISGNNLYFGNGERISNVIDGTLTVDASCVDICGNLLVNGDITITGNDLKFGNGESISNNTDGTLTVDASSVDICGNLLVEGDVTITGNDLYFGNGECISNDSDGTLAMNTELVDISGSLLVGGDVTFANGESISNNTDGTLTIDASSVDICGNLLIEGDIIHGNDLTFGNGEQIINKPDGVLTMAANQVDICGNLLVEGLITFGNGENISNNPDGTITMDASNVDICGNLLVEGDVTISGNDLYFGNGECISNDTNGTLTMNSDNVDVCGNLLVEQKVTIGGNELTFGNGETISNITDGTIVIDATNVDICGNLLVEGDVTISGNDITFGNGETISNITDGTITMNASDVDICGNLLVKGDVTISGNDLFFGNGECISNTPDGTITMDASNVDICGNLIVEKDVIFGNGESISNDIDGTLTMNADIVDICGNLVVKGDFMVYGNHTTLHTKNSVISDCIIELCNGFTGTPVNSAGIIIERGNLDNAFIGWDEPNDRFVMTTTTANADQQSIEFFPSVPADFKLGNLIVENTMKIGGQTESLPLSILEIIGTDAVIIPKGTSAQRPVQDSGANDYLGSIRYNTENSQFEGFGAGNTWGSLGGVMDIDQDTYISTMDGTTDEDHLRFYTDGVERMTIDPSGNIIIDVSCVDICGNLFVEDTMKIGGETECLPLCILEVNGTDAAIIPKGTSAQRPVQNSGGNEYLGSIRYNTENRQFEGFGAGNTWGSLGGVMDIDQDTYISTMDGTTDEDHLRFYTDGVERMTIDDSGDIIIDASCVDICGNLVITGDVILGDSPSDRIIFNGSMHSDIIPSLTETFSIGDEDHKLLDVYVSDNSLWIGAQHKIAITDGTMKFRKIDKSKVPTPVQEAGGNADAAKTYIGKEIADFTLADWKRYSKTLNVRGKGANVKMTDIYGDDEDDYLIEDQIVDGNMQIKGDLTCSQSMSFTNSNIINRGLWNRVYMSIKINLHMDRALGSNTGGASFLYYNTDYETLITVDRTNVYKAIKLYLRNKEIFLVPDRDGIEVRKYAHKSFSSNDGEHDENNKYPWKITVDVFTDKLDMTEEEHKAYIINYLSDDALSDKLYASLNVPFKRHFFVYYENQNYETGNVHIKSVELSNYNSVSYIHPNRLDMNCGLNVNNKLIIAHDVPNYIPDHTTSGVTLSCKYTRDVTIPVTVTFQCKTRMDQVLGTTEKQTWLAEVIETYVTQFDYIFHLQGTVYNMVFDRYEPDPVYIQSTLNNNNVPVYNWPVMFNLKGCTNKDLDEIEYDLLSIFKNDDLITAIRDSNLGGGFFGEGGGGKLGASASLGIVEIFVLEVSNTIEKEVLVNDAYTLHSNSHIEIKGNLTIDGLLLWSDNARIHANVYAFGETTNDGGFADDYVAIENDPADMLQFQMHKQITHMATPPRMMACSVLSGFNWRKQRKFNSYMKHGVGPDGDGYYPDAHTFGLPLAGFGDIGGLMDLNVPANSTNWAEMIMWTAEYETYQELIVAHDKDADGVMSAIGMYFECYLHYYFGNFIANFIIDAVNNAASVATGGNDGDLWNGLWDGLVGGLGEVFDAAGEFFEKAWTDFSNTPAFQAVSAAGTYAANQLANAATIAYNYTSEKFLIAYEFAEGVAIEAAEALLAYFNSTIKPYILSFFPNNRLPTLAEIGGVTIQQVVDVIPGFPSLGALGGVTMGQVVGEINGHITAVKNEISGWIPDVSLKTIVLGFTNDNGWKAIKALLNSDDRLKHNEENVSGALNIILKLKAQQYYKTNELYDEDYTLYTDDSGNYINLNEEDEVNVEIGFIAQEVELIPELKFAVHTGDDDDGTKSLDYFSIFSLNVQAVQELYAEKLLLKIEVLEIYAIQETKIEELTTTVESQGIKIEELTTTVDELTTKVNNSEALIEAQATKIQSQDEIIAALVARLDAAGL